MSIDQALEHGRPFRFASVDSTDYNAMLFGGDSSETEKLSPSIKPINSKSLPPSAATLTSSVSSNPKGYAAVVKNGKPEVQPPSSTTTQSSSSSAATNSGHSESNNKFKNDRTSQRRKSKDKKDKSKKGSGNNINWTYHSSQDKSSRDNGKDKKDSQNSNSWAAIVTKPKNEVPPPVTASATTPSKSEETKPEVHDNKTVNEENKP